MNKRIKQLAEQAMESIPDDCPSIEHSLAIFNKKFAELIVQECAKTAETCFVSWPMDGSLQRSECANAIKKQFGVKL